MCSLLVSVMIYGEVSLSRGNIHIFNVCYPITLYNGVFSSFFFTLGLLGFLF